MLRHYNGLSSLSLRRKIERLHHKFVLAAIQHNLTDLADLAFDDGGVFARKHLAREHDAGSELPRPGIELYADIRCNHRPKNGDVLLVVHAQKHEQQRLRFAARDNRAAEQEKGPADKRSPHENAIRGSKSVVVAQHAAPLQGEAPPLLSSRMDEPTCR